MFRQRTRLRDVLDKPWRGFDLSFFPLWSVFLFRLVDILCWTCTCKRTIYNHAPPPAPMSLDKGRTKFKGHTGLFAVCVAASMGAAAVVAMFATITEPSRVQCRIEKSQNMNQYMPEAGYIRGIQTITLQRQHRAIHLLYAPLMTWQLPTSLTALGFHSNLANSQNRIQWQTHAFMPEASCLSGKIYTYPQAPLFARDDNWAEKKF